MPRGSLRDPKLIGAIAVTAVLVISAAVLVGGRMPASRTIVTDIDPSSRPTGTVSPAPTVAGDEAAGTALPVATSAAVPPAPPHATATPTPDPNVWRFEGRVVTEQGRPLIEVCVVIGPNGCRPYGPHTDDEGRYYIDLPRNPTIEYDLWFEKEGYGTVYYRVTPTGPTAFDVVLRPL